MSQWQDITCAVCRCRRSGALTAGVEISRDPCKAAALRPGRARARVCVCVCVCVCEREMFMAKGLQRGAEHLLQFQGNPVVRVRATPRPHTQLCRDLSVKSLPRRRGRAVGR